MRQARYRAWDNTNNEWIDFNDVGLSLVRVPDTPDSWMVVIDRDGETYIRDDIVFHQYTGLYADDGEELCDGYIVHAYKPNSGLDGLYTITWDDKRGKWAYMKDGRIEPYQVGKAGNAHCFIRGNIHDTPNLSISQR